MPIFRACKKAKFALQHPIIFDVLASPWTTLKTEKRKLAFSWEMKSVSGHLYGPPNQSPECSHRVWSRNGREGCSGMLHDVIAQWLYRVWSRNGREGCSDMLHDVIAQWLYRVWSRNGREGCSGMPHDVITHMVYLEKLSLKSKTLVEQNGLDL